MLAHLAPVPPHGVDRPGHPATGAVRDDDRGAVPGEGAQRIPQSEATCRDVRLAATAQAGDPDDGVRRDEDLPSGGVPEEDPVGPEVDEAALDGRPGGEPQGERLPAARGVALREEDAGPLGPGAVGDLGVALAALLGLPLSVEVVEERFPPHTSALYAARSGDARVDGVIRSA